jgi:membrane associated rhomboid family serine protease
MNPAAVGHQCPECVSEGRRSQRSARTVFGGSVAGRGAPVTRTLIGVNVAVMVLSAVTGGARALGGGGGFGNLLGGTTPVLQFGEVLGRAQYVANGPVHGIAEGEWWRLVTAMFLHYGVLHLLLNMAVLWQLGRYLEEKLGPLRFAALYLLAGLGGNVAAYVFSAQNQPSAGASTAVFGLIIAIIVVNRRLRLDISQLIPLLVVNLIFTFAIPGISVYGHLGGLVVGGLVAVVIAYAPAARRSQFQALGCAIVGALLIAAAVARTFTLLA